MGTLRNLDVSQQVALLFVALFGVLALVSIAAQMRSLRDTDDEALRARRERFRRDLNAVWTGALLFWVAWVSGPVGATLPADTAVWLG